MDDIGRFANPSLLLLFSEQLLTLSQPAVRLLRFVKETSFARVDTYADRTLANPTHMVTIKRQHAYPTFVVNFIIRNGNGGLRSDVTMVVDLHTTYIQILGILDHAFRVIYERPSRIIQSELFALNEHEQRVLAAETHDDQFLPMGEESGNYGDIQISDINVY